MSSTGTLDKKTVIINSQFRESGSSSDFSWRFQERIANVRHAELRHFVFENGVYNVDSTNNIFYLSEDFALSGGGWIRDGMTVQIPVGYYDDVTLASTLGLVMSETSLANGGSTLYFVQILSNGVLSISADNNVNFAIAFSNILGSTPQPATALLLGFDNYTDINYYSSLLSGLYRTVRGDFPMSLASFDYLLVKSQKLGNDISFCATGIQSPPPSTLLTPSSAGCFAFVPNITPQTSSTTIIYENTRTPDLETLKYPFSLDYIDIQITDKYGRVVNSRDNNVTVVIDVYTDKASQNVSSFR